MDGNGFGGLQALLWIILLWSGSRVFNECVTYAWAYWADLRDMIEWWRDHHRGQK